MKMQFGWGGGSDDGGENKRKPRMHGSSLDEHGTLSDVYWTLLVRNLEIRP